MSNREWVGPWGVRCGAGMLCALQFACAPQDAAWNGTEVCGPEDRDGVPVYSLVEEWRRGGVSDTVLRLSGPLVRPTVAPGGGISFGRMPASSVLTIDGDGSYYQSVGAVGTGPGEWAGGPVGGLAWYGDTLWVTEPNRGRIHAFHASGRLLESRSVRSPADERLVPLQVLRGGTMVATMPPRTMDGGRRLVLWSEETMAADSLGLHEEGRLFRIEWPEGGIVVGERPVVDHLLYATAPDGMLVVAVDRNTARDGRPHSFRIRALARDGEKILDADVCYTPVAITEAARVDSLGRHVQALAEFRDGVPRGATEAIVAEALRIPRYWPPVAAVVVSTSNEIWLRREPRAAGEGTPWEIRDLSGLLVGFVVLPEELRVMAVDGDIVWTQGRDPLDVPVVRKMRLVPPPD